MAWQDRVSNTAAWASTGAALGSFFPGPGTAIGAGVGGVFGLLSPTDGQDRARELASGEIPLEQRNYIQKQLSGRFDQLRTQSGAGAARRGIADSSISQRLMMDIDASEREALADSFLRESMNRQAMGFDLQNMYSQQTADAVSGGIGVLMQQRALKQEKDFYDSMLAQQANQQANAPAAPRTMYTGGIGPGGANQYQPVHRPRANANPYSGFRTQRYPFGVQKQVPVRNKPTSPLAQRGTGSGMSGKAYGRYG